MVETEFLAAQPDPESKPRPGEKEKPEPREPKEPKEPNHKTPEPSREKEPDEETKNVVAMTESQFFQLVTELRKPVINPQLESRRKRTREHNRALMRDQVKMVRNRFLGCNHMQLPGSVMTGCSVIAWATQSDGRKRGICQHCGTIFSSVRSECASQEIFDAYPMLVRLPTHPAGNINSVFQSA